MFEEATHLLAELSSGKRDAFSKLKPLVYKELRLLAGHYLGQERSDQTL